MIVHLLGVFAVIGAASTWLMTRRNLRSYRHAPADAVLPDDVRVSVCIPARNEESNLADALDAVLASDHTNLEVLVYDDQSTDATPRILADFVARDPRVRSVRSVPLPPGWNGKQHACAQMGFSARGDWLLFTDADVRLMPDAIRRSVAVAQRRDVALLSTFPRQVTATLGERLIVPMIFFLLFSYLPMRRMRETLMPSASAGCGQFLLVRADAYRASAGHTAFPTSMHDGIALPRLLRRNGYRTDLFDGSDLASVRMYRGFAETWRGFVKNAYEGLGSFGLLLFLTAFHTLVFLVPWGLLIWALIAGQWRVAALSLVAIGIAILQRRTLGRRFGQPAWLAPLHPVAVLLMTLIQWHSAWRHLTGRSAWRGRGAATTEQVILVDAMDQPVGSALKSLVHRTPGHRHRAFSVVLTDGRGHVLLQQRAATKYHFAGLWANACCGHPRPGEHTADAAERRLHEELGLHLKLTPIASFTYQAADPVSGLVEHEIDHVLVGKITQTPTPNPLEVQALEWIAPEQLTRQLDADDTRFAPWVAAVWQIYRQYQPENESPVTTSLASKTPHIVAEAKRPAAQATQKLHTE